jgi:peptidoglycan hydrolase CwlO-like protein
LIPIARIFADPFTFYVERVFFCLITWPELELPLQSGYNVLNIMKTSFTTGATLFAAALIFLTSLSASAAGAATSTSSLQSQIDANNAQIDTLNQQIATYQAELQQVGANKKTLQAAINSLDLQRSKIQAQVATTQHQITITQLQIQQLGGQITDAQKTISTGQAALGAEFRSLQKADDQPLFMRILASGSIVDAWSDINATLQAQNAIEDKMQLLRQQENTLTDSKTASQQKQQTLTTQQQSLASQQQSLTATVQSKSQLLAQTKSQEATYQKLLAAAQAELASFSTFAQNAGGSKLLVNQTSCDSWGCYYNQRDAAWGNDALNGTQYRLASDGCLVTSMAMVLTHYGYKDVTPVSINSNPGNFAAYYPAYLLFTISVDGITATRKTAAIDATLATGNPVIIGLNAYGGTHYVVFVSGSKGNYVMRDPYIANGKDISFAANYSMKNIFAIAKVVIGS